MKKNLKISLFISSVLLIMMIPSVAAYEQYVGVEVGDSWSYVMSVYYENTSYADEIGNLSIAVTDISAPGDLELPDEGSTEWGTNVTFSWVTDNLFEHINLTEYSMSMVMPVYENEYVYDDFEELMEGPMLCINMNVDKTQEFTSEGYYNVLEFDYFGVLVSMNIWINDVDDNGDKAHIVVSRNGGGGVPSYVAASVGQGWTFEMELDYDDTSSYSDETINIAIALSNIGEDLGGHCIVTMDWVFTPSPSGIGMTDVQLVDPVFEDDSLYTDALMAQLWDGPLMMINPDAAKSYSWTDDEGYDQAVTYDADGVLETLDIWINADDQTKVHMTVGQTGSFEIPGFSLVPFAVISLLSIVVLIRRKR